MASNRALRRGDVRWLRAEFAATRALFRDNALARHVIESYSTADDVALELKVLRPTAGDTTGRRPAMLWFHGGSGTTGSWSHSLGVVRDLRRNGIAVVAVEYRTGSRFDVGPIELVASHQPSTLLVHAARDEYCSFDDAPVKWGWVTQSR